MSAAARVDIYRKCKNSKKELGNELRVPSTLSASVAATVDLYPMQQDDGEWYCHKELGGLSFFSRILNTWVTQKSKLIHKLPALGIVEGLIITNDGIEDGQGDTHGGSVEHYTSRPNAEEDNPMKLSDFKLCLNDLGELLERVNINGDPYHNTQSGKKKDKDKDDAGTKGSGKRKGAKSKSSNKEKGEGVHESNGTDKNNVGGTSSPGISNSAAMGRRMVDGEPTQGEMSVEDNGSEMLTENTHGSGHSDNSSDHDDEGDSDESTDSEDEDEKHFKTYPYRRPVVPSTIVGPFAGEPIRYFLASTLWYAAHYGKESLDFNDADVVSLNRIAAHLDSGEVSIQHLLRHRAPRTMNPENDMLLWLLPGTDDAILAVKAIHYMLQHPAFTEDPSLDGSLWLLKVMARDLELPSEDMRQQRLEQFSLGCHIYFMMSDRVYERDICRLSDPGESTKLRVNLVSPNSVRDNGVQTCARSALMQSPLPKIPVLSQQYSFVGSYNFIYGMDMDLESVQAHITAVQKLSKDVEFGIEVNSIQVGPPKIISLKMQKYPGYQECYARAKEVIETESPFVQNKSKALENLERKLKNISNYQDLTNIDLIVFDKGFVHIVPHPKVDLSEIEHSRKEQERGFRMEHSMMKSDRYGPSMPGQSSSVSSTPAPFNAMEQPWAPFQE